MRFTWLLVSVLCSSLGHLSLKLAASSLPASLPTARLAALLTQVITNRWLMLGITLHVTALGFWVIGLRHVPLSVAYPFIALGMVFVAILSWWLLRESIGIAQLAGMALIASGVLVIARSA